MNTNTIPFDDFDPESQSLFQGMKFLDLGTIDFEGRQNGFTHSNTNKGFEGNSNEYLKKNFLGEDSLFNEKDPKDFKSTKIDAKFTLYYDKNERFLDQATKNFSLEKDEFFLSLLLKKNSDAVSILNLKELDGNLLPTKYKFTSNDVQEVHSVYLGENILKSSLTKLEIRSLVDDYYIKKCFTSDTENARKILLDSITDKAWQYYDLYASEYSFARIFQDIIVFLNEIKSEIKASLIGIFDRILASIRSLKIDEPNRWRAKIRDKNLNWIPNPKYNPLFEIKGNNFSSSMDEWFTKIDNKITAIIGKPNSQDSKDEMNIIKTAQFFYDLLKNFFKPIYKVIQPIIATKLEFDLQCANAFLIGAINAFVEFIAGFVEIIKLIVSLFNKDEFEKMVNGFKKMLAEMEKEGFLKYVSEVFGKLWKTYTAKYKDDGDVFEDIKDITQDFGEIIITLVVAVFSGGASLVTFLKKIFKEILDCIQNPSKVIEEAIALLKKAVQQTRTITKNGGKVIAQSSKKAVQKVRMGYKMIEREVFLYTLSKGSVLRCTILPFEEFFRLFGKGLTIAIRRKLLKFGIEIAEHEGRYFIKYQDELFELGDKKAVNAKLKEIFDKTEDEVRKHLDEIKKLAKHRIFVNYVSKLTKLVLNENLPKQIANASNNFKKYFLKIEDGKLMHLDEVFDTSNDYIDWIIDENNELLFGHGHGFLSNHSKNIKNAGGALIKEGKIVGLSNGSGHYLPKLEYMDESLNLFKELEILSSDYRVLRYKYKI